MSDFKYRHFKGAIILQCVRWYCNYGISYRNLEEMMCERGITVDHTTLYRWVQKYAPEIEKRLRWYRKGFGTTSWRVDETYIKVKGHWKYFYRAVDSKGNTLDFYLSHTRNTKAATTFLQKCLNKSAAYKQTKKVNSDLNPAYNASIRKLKVTGKCSESLVHQKIKYLNNIVESDHGKLKRLIKPTLGFKKMKTAYATLKGFEVMHMFRKRQFSAWTGFPENVQERVMGEVRLINKIFYVWTA